MQASTGCIWYCKRIIKTKLQLLYSTSFCLFLSLIWFEFCYLIILQAYIFWNTVQTMRISQFYFYTKFSFACKNQHLMLKAPTDKDNTPDKKLGNLMKQKTKNKKPTSFHNRKNMTYCKNKSDCPTLQWISFFIACTMT